jgi:predicted NBD/HSP70 family sugar kinase
MENAANACVLAEVWFGRTDLAKDIALITVSEGVGVGIFSGGRLVVGTNGMAGELGHVPIDFDGPKCGCGARGCWEVYASNWAALRHYQELKPSASGTTYQDLLTLAEGGDASAKKAVERQAHAIGRGMRMIIATLSPEEIVFVGEFTRLWNRLGPLIEADVASAVLVGKPPLVRPAAAEPSVARLRGTVALVLQKHFGPSLDAREAPALQRAEARLG